MAPWKRTLAVYVCVFHPFRRTVIVTALHDANTKTAETEKNEALRRRKEDCDSQQTIGFGRGVGGDRNWYRHVSGANKKIILVFYVVRGKLFRGTELNQKLN